MNTMQLALLRGQVSRFLTETCRIEVQDSGTGSMGEPINSWSIVADNVPCRILAPSKSSMSAAEQAGGQETIHETYPLICPAGTALAVNQRVTVGGVTYHVTRLVTDRTDEADTQAIIERARTA